MKSKPTASSVKPDAWPDGAVYEPFNEQVLIDLSHSPEHSHHPRVVRYPKLGAITERSLEMKSLESIESSDTFATCYTHPFTSLADLTADSLEPEISLPQDANPTEPTSPQQPPLMMPFEMSPTLTDSCNSKNALTPSRSPTSEQQQQQQRTDEPPAVSSPTKVSFLHSLRSCLSDEHPSSSSSSSNHEHPSKSTFPKWIALKARSRSRPGVSPSLPSSFL